MFTRDYKELANGDYGQVMSTLGDELVVGSDVEIRLKYFAPGDGLKTGTMIRITLPPGFCPVQNIDIERPGFLLINGSFKHRLVLRKNLNFSVELEEDIQSGDAIEFVYNPKGRNMKPVATKVCYKDLVELDLDVKKQGDELYSRVFKKMIRLAPEKPAYIFIAIPSIVEEDERFDIHINVRDCYDNISTGFQGAIELYGNDQVLEYPRKITFYEQDRGNKVIEKACCFNIRVIPDSDEEMLLKQPKGYGVLSQPPEVENC